MPVRIPTTLPARILRFLNAFKTFWASSRLKASFTNSSRINEYLCTISPTKGNYLQTLNSRDIGFKLGPRLNAAGRMESGKDSYLLLITENEEVASSLATKLNSLNQDRQDLLPVFVVAPVLACPD